MEYQYDNNRRKLKIYDGYTDEIDYFQLLLNLYSDPKQKHRRKYFQFYDDVFSTYEEELTETLRCVTDKKARNILCHKKVLNVQSLMKKGETANDLFKKVIEANGQKVIEEYRSYFVTIDCDPNKTTWLHLTNLGRNICHQKWCDKAEYVYEFTGHPHIHMIIHTTDKKISKGKLIDKIWQTAGIKSHLNDRQKIDVKEYKTDLHDAYIRGSKTDTKMDGCQTDYDLREQYGLPHLVTYEAK